MVLEDSKKNAVFKNTSRTARYEAHGPIASTIRCVGFILNYALLRSYLITVDGC
jgi:hypothetical protein